MTIGPVKKRCPLKQHSPATYDSCTHPADSSIYPKQNPKDVASTFGCVQKRNEKISLASLNFSDFRMSHNHNQISTRQKAKSGPREGARAGRRDGRPVKKAICLQKYEATMTTIWNRTERTTYVHLAPMCVAWTDGTHREVSPDGTRWEGVDWLAPNGGRSESLYL